MKCDLLGVAQMGSALRQVQPALLRRSQHAEHDVGAATAAAGWLGDPPRSARSRLLRRPQHALVSCPRRRLPSQILLPVIFISKENVYFDPPFFYNMSVCFTSSLVFQHNFSIE